MPSILNVKGLKNTRRTDDMARRKTNEEFTNEVYDLVGNEYIFLEKYIRDGTKIKCRHNKCGHEWYITPSSF